MYIEEKVCNSQCHLLVLLHLVYRVTENVTTVRKARINDSLRMNYILKIKPESPWTRLQFTSLSASDIKIFHATSVTNNKATDTIKREQCTNKLPKLHIQWANKNFKIRALPLFKLQKCCKEWNRITVAHTLLKRKCTLCRQDKSANPAGDLFTLRHSEFTS